MYLESSINVFGVYQCIWSITMYLECVNVSAKSTNRFEVKIQFYLCQKKNNDDRKFLKTIASAVMQLQFKAENMPLDERDLFIFNELNKMEKNNEL